MNIIRVIAFHTFYNCLRAKSLALVIFFGIMLGIFMNVAGGADLTCRAQLVMDTGLSLVKVFAILLVVFIILPLIEVEREHRTLMAMLSLPVSRSQVIWGIWFGGILALALNFFLMVALLIAMLWWFSIPFSFLVLRHVILLFVEVAVLSAMATLFSLISGFVVAVMLTGFSFALGNMALSVREALHAYGNGFTGKFLALVSRIFPDFSLFDVKDLALQGRAMPWDYDLWAIIYGLALCYILIELAIIKFSREEIL